MRIVKYGTITILQDQGPKIEGWQVERELTDPVDAKDEELLLDVVMTWAREKFRAACNSAVMDVARRRQEANPTTKSGLN